MAKIQYCESCLPRTKSVDTLYNNNMIQLIGSNKVVVFKRF